VINLISTSDKVQLTPSSTSTLEVRTDWVEATTVAGVIQDSTFVPGNQRTSFTAATIADILSAPAANKVRNVKLIIVRNTGAANPALNTVLCEVVNRRERRSVQRAARGRRMADVERERRIVCVCDGRVGQEQCWAGPLSTHEPTYVGHELCNGR
jgi:hypothetical protein